MRPRLSWPVLLALALLVAGFATSGLQSTLALASHLPSHSPPAQRSPECSGFFLSGAVSSCLTVTSVVCNPAGTVDPETGVRVAAARVRVSADATGNGSAALILTAASTTVKLTRGSQTTTLHGAAAAAFSVAGGVSADQDLSDEVTAATSHLTGAVACV